MYSYGFRKIGTNFIHTRAHYLDAWEIPMIRLSSVSGSNDYLTVEGKLQQLPNNFAIGSRTSLTGVMGQTRNEAFCGEISVLYLPVLH